MLVSIEEETNKQHSQRQRLMAASIAYAAASAAAGPAFEGDDAWVGAQLGRKAAKAKHRARRNADPTIIVPFNRDEFTERVKVRVIAFPV
jgi:hypothetical protein